MDHNCPICHESTCSITHKKLGTFYKCDKCDFIHKDRNHLITLKQELAIYNNHNNSIDDPKYVAFFNRFLYKAVFPYVNSGKKAFDFGSGPTPVLAQILQRYHQYDMVIYDLFYATNKSYINKKFDLITSTEVLEHVKDPISTFKLLVSLLKKDGVLAIMTLYHPNNDDDFLKWYYIRDPSHISFYSLKTMHVIANMLNCEIIYSDYHRYTTFKLK